MLTREELLSRPVQVKEIELTDGTVFIRKWRGSDRTKMMQLTEAHKHKENAVVALVSLCDEQGKLLFADKELDKVNDLDSNDLAAIVKAAFEFNTITLDDAKKG